jgi:DNA-binding MarR family transcriptional regulator
VVKKAIADENPDYVNRDGSRMGILKSYIGIPLRLAHRSVLYQVNELLAQVALAPAEFAILAVIEANPKAMFGDIGSLLGIKKGNFAPVIANMQKQGLVKRTTSTVDARRQHLSLTAAGKKELARGKRLHDSLEAHLIEHLGKTTHDDLVNLLYQLANIPLLAGDASAMDKHKLGID